MKISCSRCGAEHEFRYCAGNVFNKEQEEAET